MRVFLTAAVAALLWLPGAARAQTYVVSACKAGGAPAPLDGWVPSVVGAFWDQSKNPAPPWNPVVNDCAGGGSFGVDLAYAMAARDAVAQWSFDAPTGTTIVGLKLTRIARVADDTTSPTFHYSLTAGGVGLENAPDDLPPEAPFSDAVFAGLSAHDLRLQTRCRWDMCALPMPQRALVSAADVTLRDDGAPTATNVVAAGDAVKIGFSDTGGGVESAVLTVDGVAQPAVPVGGATCRRPFVAVVPCPLSGEVALPVPAGRHTVTAALVDVAGNRTATAAYLVGSAATASVATSNPASAAPVAAARAGRLVVSGARTLRTRYAAPPTLRGTVRDLGGAPIGKATVAVSTRATGAGGWTAAAPVTTDAKGRFSLRLARGVSREVRLEYGDSVETLKVIVKAPVRLKTDRRSTRNGRAITFLGGVPGAGGAPARVELQAWAGSWIPFKTVALRNGHFKGSYRFTRTYATMRYRFRAVLRADPGFPYAAGESSVVSVLVRP